MNRFIAVLLLVFGWVAQAHAEPRGKAFFKGVENPQKLAVMVEQALIGDPTGKSMINTDACRKTASCASPADYLKTLQKSDPDAHLSSLSDLPSYLRSLRMEEAPAGKYWMACLRHSRTSPTGYEPLLHCLARAFKPGEKVWINPQTKRIVLAADCTNPVEKPEVPVVKNPCVYEPIYMKVGDSVRFKQYGPKNASSHECTALKRAGESDYESPFVERCPQDEHCDFSVPDADLGEVGFEQGSFTATVSGYQVFRLPPEFAEEKEGYIMVFCLEREGAHSCGMDVRWFDFVPDSGTKAATIYGDASQAGPAKDVRGRPTWLWWKWVGIDSCYRPLDQQ